MSSVEGRPKRQRAASVLRFSARDREVFRTICQLRSGGICANLNVAGTPNCLRAAAARRPWRDSCERSGASAFTPMPRRHLPGLERARVPRDEPGDRRRDAVRAPDAVRRVHSRAGRGRPTACHEAAGLLRDAQPLASRRATRSRSSAVGVHAVADDNARTAMATGVLHSRSRRRVSGSFQVGARGAGSPLPPALPVRRAESGSCEDHDARRAMALVQRLAARSQILRGSDAGGMAGDATCRVERPAARGLVPSGH